MDWQAVVFDMDGVLVDSEPMHFATTNEVLLRRGCRVEQAFYDACLGLPEVDFFGRVVAHLGMDEAPEQLARERIQASLRALAAGVVLPMEGALECVLRLRSDGLRLGLASSATRAQVALVVDRLGLRGSLAALVSVDEVGRGKPAPDVFDEAARRLGVSPAHCVVVEDAVAGVTAATAAGMASIALVPDAARAADPWLAAGAWARVRSLHELTPEFLERLARP